MTAQQIIDTRSARAEFSNFATAQNFVTRCHESKWAIVMGDNGRFWVVCNRHASVLVASGYEYAE